MVSGVLALIVRRFTIPKVTRIPSPVRASESVGIVPDAEEVWPEPCDEASRPLADQHLCGASRLIRNRAAHGARSAGGREEPGASREDSRRQSRTRRLRGMLLICVASATRRWPPKAGPATKTAADAGPPAVFANASVLRCDLPREGL